MVHPLVEYFRCPEHLAVLGTAEPLALESGYFRFGDAVCYGRQSVGPPSPRPDGSLVDVALGVTSSNGKVLLPFDLSDVLGNLRHERYPEAQRAIEHIASFNLSHAAYYFFRPVLPVRREEAPPEAPLEGLAEHPVSPVARRHDRGNADEEGGGPRARAGRRPRVPLHLVLARRGARLRDDDARRGRRRRARGSAAS